MHALTEAPAVRSPEDKETRHCVSWAITRGAVLACLPHKTYTFHARRMSTCIEAHTVGRTKYIRQAIIFYSSSFVNSGVSDPLSSSPILDGILGTLSLG